MQHKRIYTSIYIYNDDTEDDDADRYYMYREKKGSSPWGPDRRVTDYTMRGNLRGENNEFSAFGHGRLQARSF